MHDATRVVEKVQSVEDALKTASSEETTAYYTEAIDILVELETSVTDAVAREGLQMPVKSGSAAAHTAAVARTTLASFHIYFDFPLAAAGAAGPRPGPLPSVVPSSSTA